MDTQKGVFIENQNENSVTDKNTLGQSDNNYYNQAWYWKNCFKDDIIDSKRTERGYLYYGSKVESDYDLSIKINLNHDVI